MNQNSFSILAVLSLIIIGAGTYAHIHIDNIFAGTIPSCVATPSMPSITAQSAYVYDIKTSAVIFEKNSEAQLPLASLTKLATALTASQTLSDGERVHISEWALAPEGDSGFSENETWELKDLLAFTLITSSNDGARAIALAADNGSLEDFITKMNDMVRSVGLSQTFFLNETGLDVSSSTAGAYGSARDVALLLTHAYETDRDVLTGSAQAANVFTSLSGLTHTAKHTSAIAGVLPGEVIVKTGFTDLAGGNLAVLEEVFPGRPVAIVVLGATKETRDEDVYALAQAARNALKRATLCAKGT